MSEAFGVIVPLAEAVVQEIGEEEAMRQARLIADARAFRAGADPALCTVEGSLVQAFPWTDRESGEVLPPLRAFRFRYGV